MHIRNSVRLVASFALLMATQIAFATTITYDVNNISGTTWTYDFEVFNDSLSSGLEEFTVFFEVNAYQNLSVVATPSGWDPLAIQPDPTLPDDGFFDALALTAGGLVPGDSLGGFIVQFDFLGIGTPGSQAFDVVDPVTFATLDSGFTQAAVVPVPAAVWLFGSGLVMFSGALRRRGQA